MNWKNFLQIESEKSYFLKIKETLNKEREKYKIYPPEELIFNAFKITPFDKVKVIILSQDPYYGPN